MASSSITAITTMDLFVVITAIAISIAVCRQRPVSFRKGPARAAGLFVFGLMLMGAFYLIDVVALHAFRLLNGPEQGFVLWNSLHTSAEWVALAIALPMICVGFVLDSRERKRAEAQLEASESRYRSIVRDQLDMIVRWQPNGTRTWVNEPYCRLLGLTSENAIGSSIFREIADAEQLKALIRTLTPESPVDTGHINAILPDGSTSWQEWVSRGLFDEAGNLREIQSIGRDVTSRMRTAKALQESESRFRGFVENTPDFVWEADLELRCIYCNQQSRQLFGYEPGEMKDRSLLELLHPDISERARAGLSINLSTKTGWRNMLLKVRHRDGSTRYIESSADPVLDQNGDVTGFRGVDRDRTFQTLLTRVSTDLVGCKADEVNEKIDQSLTQIGQSYELDRISIWAIKRDFVLCEHQWADEGISAILPQIAHMSEMPGAKETLVNGGETYKVESVNRLDKDSSERKFLEAAGIKSVMALPLYSEGSIVAFAGVSVTESERTWPDNIEAELRLLFGKIIDAKTQADNTLSILRRERDLSQSEELAHVGSYAFYPTLQAREFPDGWEATFSAKQCALLEIDPGDASIELFLSRIHEDDRQRIEASIGHLVNEGKKFEQEFRFMNSSGSTVHISGSAELEVDRFGCLSRIVGSCRDITEQTKREVALVNALQENEALRDRLQEENVQLREEIRSSTEFEQIIGDSTALRSSLNLAARAAPTDSTILILGETGTGKELVAKAIHQLSARSEQRLVSINCTALPPNLIESELFGHEKGAFTGATARRAGRFENADGGTLFLDEIGDLPVELQSKLLRVLEDGGFERIGGNETIRPNVRLVAATNRNLEEAVRAGRFRADLYYRINTVPIEMPPLRDRKEDIPMLAQHFVDKHRDRLGKSVIAISSRMIDFLLNRDWPGNVRELEHYIERSLISATGKVLSIGEQTEEARPALSAVQPEIQTRIQPGKPTELKSVEREHILQVLGDTGWVIDGNRGAAAVLGLAPSTLRSRMKRLGIARRA